MVLAQKNPISGKLGVAMRTLTTSAAFSTCALSAYADMARYELDPTHTAIYFTIDHIGYAKTLGVFTDVTGSFMYNTETQELRDVEVVIQAASINTFNDARDGHVRNRDFLDVTTYPEIRFVASGGTPSDASSGTVTGELTVLDQSLPVTLNVTLNKVAEYPFGHKREVLGLSMDTSILRSEFGMDYGVENGLVGDEVAINIETEAIKSEG